LKSRLLAVKAGSLPLEPGLQPAASRFLKLLNEVGEAPPPLMPLPMMGALILVLFFSRRWTDRHHLNSETGIHTQRSLIMLRKGR
jgi:hypothetical protein